MLFTDRAAKTRRDGAANRRDRIMRGQNHGQGRYDPAAAYMILPCHDSVSPTENLESRFGIGKY